MKKILFLTEISSKIGMGHFYQSYALAENLQEHDIYFAFDEMSNVPKIIHKVTEHNLQMYHNILNIEAIVNEIEPDFVILNFRNFPEGINQFLFFDKKIKTIIYDDKGGLKVACNLLINYTFSKKTKIYNIYSSKEETKMFFGAEFFPIRKQFYNISDKNQKSNTITIFMGGSDRSNVSGKIADDILNFQDKHFSINIVIGTANKNKKALYQKFENNNKITILENIENIAEVFSKTFIAINTGGTAMYELAFLGIPTIILWEDEHEKQLAKDFQKKGFSQTAGQCETYKTTDLYESIRFLSEKEIRKQQETAGMQLTDAKKGLRTIKKIINNNNILLEFNK